MLDLPYWISRYKKRIHNHDPQKSLSTEIHPKQTNCESWFVTLDPLLENYKICD